MPKPEIPPGCVLIRLTDLAGLLAARSPAPEPDPPDDAWSGLGAAVAMVTARLGRHDVGLDDLAEGIAAESIIAALVAMAAVGLRCCLEGRTEKFLQDMGEIAVTRGMGPDGKAL